MVYDAYGAVKFYNSSWTLQSGDSLNLRQLYQGMRLDSAIGWYLTGQSNVDRWYSPTMDVWNREDTAGDVNGLNLYGFVERNPINRVDPRGLDDTSPAPGYYPLPSNWFTPQGEFIGPPSQPSQYPPVFSPDQST